MGLHDSFKHLKHKLWLRERSGVKLPIWLPTTNSRESTQLSCSWKALNKGSNFASNLISIRGLHTKLWGSKVARVPTLGIESPRTKCHLDKGFMERHKTYYKGKGDGFPQLWAVVSLVSPSLPMVRPSTKSAQMMH
jgi:hypothetical protein